jgi:hypothetical protein
MRRRDFLTQAGLATGALALPPVAKARNKKPAKQFLELRTYHFASPEKQQAFEQFLESAAVPAFNRAGARPVGVFKLLMNDNPDLKLTADNTDLYVLLPHSSVESLALFNQGGELGIFSRSGMTGVFFGQTLVGSKLPNLTYMLSFPNEQDQKKAWDTFRSDPEWKRLSAAEEYKDAVSNVTNLILRPSAASQV